MSSVATAWGIRVSVAGLLIYLVLGLILAVSPKGTVTPLVGQDSWTYDDQFIPMTGRDRDIPREVLAAPGFRIWRSKLESEGGRGQAEIRTGSFHATKYIGVPHFGFPGERADTRIYVRCDATRAEFDVAQTMTNADWAVAYLKMSPSFCAGTVQLVATVSDPEFYVGIGTPFSITATRYYSETTFPVRALVIFAVWVCLVGIIETVGYASSRPFPGANPLAAGLVGLGAGAMLIFIAFHFSTIAGSILASVAGLGGLIASGILLSRKGLRDQWIAEYGLSLVCWLLVALTYGALVSAIDHGAGNWAINGAFQPVRWSSDNQLPWWFAEAMFDGTPREQIGWGSWLASDRPPLLAALLLIFRTVVFEPLSLSMGSAFIGTASMMAGIVILASWVAVLHQLALRWTAFGANIVIALAVVSPFFLFNTVYTWPKILGATYAILAASQLLKMRMDPARANSTDLAIVAMCASLSYLCHASNAFALLGIAIVFLPTILRQGLSSIGIACFAGALVAAPWFWWQTNVQPHGNALLRYALTGEFGADRRQDSIAAGALQALATLGVWGWIDQRITHLKMVVGFTRIPWLYSAMGPATDHGILGRARIEDFAILARSIMFALPCLPLVAVSGFISKLRDRLAVQRVLLWAGVLSLGLMIATMFPLMIMPAVSYGAVMLIFASGAMALVQISRTASLVILGISTLYCVVVWVIHPLTIALRVDWSALVAFAIGCAALTTLLAAEPLRYKAVDAQ